MLRRMWIFLPVLLLATSVGAEQDVAVSTKVQGEVLLKRATANSFSSGITIGTGIRDQDNIRTGENGFGVLVFLDDKSQLKIQPETAVEIQGETAAKTRAIAKQINMDSGKLKAEISEQREGEFVVATPTSVAAVKGTIFWIMVDPQEGDRVIVESGEVELTNRNSGNTITVGQNQTGSSDAEGNLDLAVNLKLEGNVREYTPNTSLTLTNISVVEGEIPEETDFQETGPLTVSFNQYSTIDGDQPSAGDQVTITGELHSDGDFFAYVVGVMEEVFELEIPFENEEGEEKTLEIRYK